MNHIANMKKIYNYFYHYLKEEEAFNPEEAQNVFHELEQLFYATVAQEEVEFDRKDEMMLALENEAKQKLRLLEEKAQKGSNISNIQEQTNHLANIIQEFWHEAGFHYVKDFSVNNYGTVELELGFSLGYGTMTTDKPVTAEQEKQKTKSRLLQEGYILNTKETQIMDCDSNKEKIVQFLVERFPSAAVFSWETFIENRKINQHHLRSMNVRIPKIEEILHIKTPH